MNPFASSALPASDCATDAASAAPASDPAATPLDEASAQAPGHETAARTADAGETPENGVSESASSETANDEPADTGNASGENAFAALGLAPELVQAVADMGYTAPTPVQQQAIPLALPQAGSDAFIDLMVCSQTGSGKTAAFLLPMLHTLIGMQAEAAEREKAEWQARVAQALARGEPAPKKPRRKNPTDRRNFKPAVPGALVLCPTRELAQQVAGDAIELVRHVRGLRIATIVGGMPYQMQIARLQNANLVVATPGRLLDLSASGQVRLDGVRFLVLDEADRMLDLGFADALAEIHLQTQQRQQTMMFSATFAPRIQQLAMRVMREGGAHAKRIEIASPQERHANIEQQLYWADTPEHRRALLDHWLRSPEIDQAIVFACTQVECEELAQDLQQSGFAAVSLHGALSQALRNRRLKALRDGRVQILVATDVAARGLDVPTLSHVFNYGLPMKAEDYTHRIGRTGRAGRDGLAVTLAEIRDRRRLADIEAYTRQPFAVHTIAGLEPQKHFPPVTAPRPAGGAKGKHGQGGRKQGRQQDWQPRFERGGRKFESRFDSRSGDRFEERFDSRRPAGGRRFDERFGERSDARFSGRDAGRFERRQRDGERFVPRGNWQEGGWSGGSEHRERFADRAAPFAPRAGRRNERFESFDRSERAERPARSPRADRFERPSERSFERLPERDGRRAPREAGQGERFKRFERRNEAADGQRPRHFEKDAQPARKGKPEGKFADSYESKPGSRAPYGGASTLRRWGATAGRPARSESAGNGERPARRPYTPRG